MSVLSEMLFLFGYTGLLLPHLLTLLFLFFFVSFSLCPPQILCAGQKAHLGDSYTGLESQIG